MGYAEKEIGVDVEQVKDDLDRRQIADMILTELECAYVFGRAGSTGEVDRFTALGTAKES